MSQTFKKGDLVLRIRPFEYRDNGVMKKGKTYIVDNPIAGPEQ